MIPITLVLLLSAVVFAIGLFGLLIVKSGIRMLMCIELLLNSANINLVAFSGMYGNVQGQVLALLAIAIAAAEAVIGFAILLVIFRHRGEINTDRLNVLRW